MRARIALACVAMLAALAGAAAVLLARLVIQPALSGDAPGRALAESASEVGPVRLGGILFLHFAGVAATPFLATLLLAHWGAPRRVVALAGGALVALLVAGTFAAYAVAPPPPGTSLGALSALQAAGVLAAGAAGVLAVAVAEPAPRLGETAGAALSRGAVPLAVAGAAILASCAWEAALLTGHA